METNYENERWRPIPYTFGTYEVSDMGRVRSNRYVVKKRQMQRRVLKPSKHDWGYLKVDIIAFNHPCCLIHKLVMETFVGPAPKGLQVNHRDGDKTNNRLDNLEYVTRSENLKHAFRTGLYRKDERGKFITGCNKNCKKRQNITLDT